MLRIAGPLLACALALANAPAHAQAGATPATRDKGESAQSSAASELNEQLSQPPTADDVCRALEQSAAENALPVEFFARYKLGRAGKKSPCSARPHCHQKCLPTGHIFALGCLSRLAEMSKNAAKYRIDSVACLCT